MMPEFQVHRPPIKHLSEEIKQMIKNLDDQYFFEIERRLTALTCVKVDSDI